MWSQFPVGQLLLACGLLWRVTDTVTVYWGQLVFSFIAGITAHCFSFRGVCVYFPFSVPTLCLHQYILHVSVAANFQTFHTVLPGCCWKPFKSPNPCPLRLVHRMFLSCLCGDYT